MFGFVEILKALAAILITNSHLGGFWPTSSFAVGGMLGDVLFFSVSGFCLYYIKLSFPLWYLKRIIRIYPMVWIATIISLLIGYIRIYSFWDCIQLFIYPTYYHFVGSIMMLYIVYYFLMVLHHKLHVKLEWMIIVTFTIQLIIYFCFFDRSTYHIDVVEDYMAKFIFLQSMLLGACFRKKYDNNKIQSFCKLKWLILSLVLGTSLYIISSMAFRKINVLTQLQILSPVILFFLIALIFYFFCIMERQKKINLNNPFGKIVKHLSKITLEIYVTQYLVYYIIPHMVFPLNIIVVICVIVLSATVMNFIGNFLTKNLDKLLGANK